MTRRYLENLDQEGGDVVEKGTYTVEIVDARPTETSKGGWMLWIDMKILGGPDANRVVSVSLNLPTDDSSRGELFHFRKKIRAFASILVQGKVWELPDDDQPDAIADAILGQKIEADLSVQQGGEFDGTQQLDKTHQSVEVPAVAAQNNGEVVNTNTVASVSNAVPMGATDDDPPF